MTLCRWSLLAASFVLFASAGALTARAADIGASKTDLWTGVYVGAQAGYLAGTGSDTDLCDASEGFGSDCYGNSEGLSFGDIATNGGTVGGYAGFNYRVSSVVLGLEGDLNWDGAQASNKLGGEYRYDTDLNWDAAVRARLGFLIDERAMVYLTGGPSWINAELNSKSFCVATFSVPADCGDTSTEFGWQLGAGAELFVTDRISVKAEYLHGWYGDANLDLARANIDGITETSYLKQNLQTNVMRAGIAYHFGSF